MARPAPLTGISLYSQVAQDIASLVIRRYSTSFGSASRLLPRSQRRAIAAVYGLVRCADEVVDTYRGTDARDMLDDLEKDTLRAVATGFSAHPLVHAFAQVARQYRFDDKEIAAFFASMRFDLSPPIDRPFTLDEYRNYIYGSAEVVGLMCLHVFCESKPQQFDQLSKGARALGAAFQKINFLRDCGFDRKELARYYFPLPSTEISESDKHQIIVDIRHDLDNAHAAALRLPVAARPAVLAAHTYFSALTDKMSKLPIDTLLQRRVRLPNQHKAALLARALVGRATHPLKRTSV